MKSKKDTNTKIKLHFGCGNNYLDDWINIDNNSDNNIQKLDLDLDLDFKKPLPFKENCADTIYDAQFLERIKLGPTFIEFLLSYFKHILKPNGLLKIGLSDMKHKEKLEPWLKKLGFPKLEFCEENKTYGIIANIVN